MRRDRGKRRAAVGLLALTVLAVSGCTRIEEAMAAVPFLNFMHEAPSLDPYEAPRPAPPNSVPLESPAGGWEPTIATPVTEAALNAFAAEVTNPLAMDTAVLRRGGEVYQTYCFVCHGDRGQGNGPVVDPAAGKFPMGPSLTIPTTVGRSDGYIYAVVKAGRGLMPAYRRIPPEDRWAVVNYVRQLQGGGQAQAGPAAQPAQPAPAGTDTAATGGQE